jgi:hypothetical protein
MVLEVRGDLDKLIVALGLTDKYGLIVINDDLLGDFVITTDRELIAV